MTEFKLIKINFNPEENEFLQRAIGLLQGSQSSYVMNEDLEPILQKTQVIEWGKTYEHIKKKYHLQHVIAITSDALSDEWFSHTEGMVTLISTCGWQGYFSPPGLHCFLLCEFLIAAYIQTIRLNDLKPPPHDNPVGCLLDHCGYKHDVQWKLRCGYLCDEHRSAFRRLGGSDEQIGSITTALNTLRREAIGAAPADSRHSTTCDVLVVTALQSELEAFKRSLATKGGWSKMPQKLTGDRQNQNISITQIVIDGKSYIIAAASQDLMGPTDAAILTTQGVTRLRPKLVLMPGISAGVEGDKRNPGDILIADPAINYASGKIKSGGAHAPDPRPIPIDDEIQSLVKSIQDDKSALQLIHEEFNGEKPEMQIKVHIGPLGSADQVIDDENVIAKVKEHHRKLIGLEMEAYGVYRACHKAPVEPIPKFVAAKSISDYAANKTDRWHSYALYTSSRFAVLLIQRFLTRYQH